MFVTKLYVGVSALYLPRVFIIPCCHGDIVIKIYKYLNQNAYNRIPGELASHIYETYKNSSMPHGHHNHKIAADMAMAAICDFRHTNILCLTGNMCCAVVQNVKLFSFLKT